MKGIRLLVFALFTLTFALLASLSWFYAWDFMRPVYSTPAFTPASYDLPYEEITLTASDGVTLTAWYVPPPEGSNRALVYLHGISSSRLHLLDMAAKLHVDGYGGLLLDLRGHGGSTVDHRTMGVTEVLDVQAATDYLLAQDDVAHVGVMGPSFGASVALLSAAHIPQLEVAVAMSPYSSLVDVVGDRAWQMYKLPARPSADLVIWWMNAQTGENIYAASPRDAITQITDRPVLLVHGALDPVIPVVNAERIVAAGGDNVTYWLLDNVGHETDWYVTNHRYAEVRAFLDGAFAAERVQAGG